MITLPLPPRRATLRAFWLLVCLLAGVVSSLLVVALGAGWMTPSSILLALLLLSFLLACGWTRPEVLKPVYRIWNEVALLASKLARVWITLMSFAVVWAAGRAGSRMTFRRAERDSGWTPRTSAAPEPLSNTPGGDPTRNGWLPGFLMWSREPGNTWARALIPFLIVLRVVHVKRESGLGGDVYTLF